MPKHGHDNDSRNPALGPGRVGFSIANRGGTIAPGPGIGRTNLLANLAATRGVLAIEVEGSSADQMSVAGTARLGGALEVTPIGGYRPRAGDSWTILTATGGITGQLERISPGYSMRIVGDPVVVTFGARQSPLARAAGPTAANPNTARTGRMPRRQRRQDPVMGTELAARLHARLGWYRPTVPSSRRVAPATTAGRRRVTQSTGARQICHVFLCTLRHNIFAGFMLIERSDRRGIAGLPSTRGQKSTSSGRHPPRWGRLQGLLRVQPHRDRTAQPVRRDDHRERRIVVLERERRTLGVGLRLRVELRLRQRLGLPPLRPSRLG